MAQLFLYSTEQREKGFDLSFLHRISGYHSIKPGVIYLVATATATEISGSELIYPKCLDLVFVLFCT